MDETGSKAESDESSLWAAARAGDADAFATLFDRHAHRVHRQAQRFSATREDAEDVTAVVFLEAWRLRSRVRVVDGSVIGWLLVTAANIARNGSRARIRHERLVRSLRPEHAPDPAEVMLADEQNGIARDRMGAAFGRLSARDQEILALCVIEQIAPSDAAQLLRVPAGTVRTRLSRAKDRLRAAMTEISGEGLDGERSFT